MLIIALSVLPLLNIAGHLSIQFAAISTIILVRKLQGEQIGAAMKSERDGINVLAKPSGIGCVECLANGGWLAMRADPDLFDERLNAPRRPLAASTLQAQSEHLRLSASVLIESGLPVEEIGFLADLIQPERLKTVLRHYHKQANGEPRKIAADLNGEGIPAPCGGQWNASTINGHRGRRNGIPRSRWSGRASMAAQPTPRRELAPAGASLFGVGFGQRASSSF